MAADTAVIEGAETQQAAPAFIYPITVEDAGTATKKVTVEIPEAKIQSAIAEQFKELKTQAALPGFRPGRVPQKLIEKKFAKDVRDQVTSTLLRESYQQAVEKNNLQVIGEPDFEDEANLKLPEHGDLKYSFNVEVQPEFTVPDLGSLTIKKPKVQINEEHVQQALANLREQQGTLLPVEDRGIKEGDVASADIHVKVGEEVIQHQHDHQFRVRAGTVAGLKIDDLAARLEGAKVDETRTITLTAPEDHSNEKLKGKEVAIEFKIKDVREMELAEINDEFLQQLGFDKQEQLLAALREEMEIRVKNDVQNAMRDQVAKALLEATPIELPAKLSKRQEGRIVQRRAVDLLQRGIPEDQIRGNIELLQQGASDEAVRELKLNFILSKIAQDQNIEVTESELNGNIAAIASQRGIRPEKLKQQMTSEGSLQTLYVRLVELKAIDRILEHAKIEEVEPEKKD